LEMKRETLALRSEWYIYYRRLRNGRVVTSCDKRNASPDGWKTLGPGLQ
jgi:hypothetical protein